jgi:hypothetical protein
MTDLKTSPSITMDGRRFEFRPRSPPHSYSHNFAASVSSTCDTSLAAAEDWEPVNNNNNNNNNNKRKIVMKEEGEVSTDEEGEVYSEDEVEAAFIKEKAAEEPECNHCFLIFIIFQCSLPISCDNCMNNVKLSLVPVCTLYVFARSY